MIIYDNEISKIYPNLNPTAPQEPQTYQLKKLTEIEAYLLDEIEVRGHLQKHETTIQQYNKQYNHKYC